MRPMQDRRYVISLLLIGAAFIVTLLVLFRADTSPEMVGAVVSAWVTTAVATVVSYWLGSSKGSAEKGDVLRDQARATLPRLQDDAPRSEEDDR